MTQDEIDVLLVWRVGRVMTQLGLEINGDFALLHKLAHKREKLTVEGVAALRSNTTTATTTKAGPVVEITSTSPGAAATTEPAPSTGTSGWERPVPEAGRSFDETTLVPPAAERARARRGNVGFLSGLF